MSAPFPGPAKELGRDMQVGIETYFRHVNETAGGMHGRKLKLLALDDGYDPQRCADTMKEMLDQRPVFAFVGNVGTPTAEVALPLVLAHKRVLFGAFTGAGLLRRDPPDRYVFNYRASYAEETAAIVHYLLTVRNVKPDAIAVFAQQDGYGDAGFSGVAKALRKVGFRLRANPPGRLSAQHDGPSTRRSTAFWKHRDRDQGRRHGAHLPAGGRLYQAHPRRGNEPDFYQRLLRRQQRPGRGARGIAPQYAAGVIVTQVVPFSRLERHRRSCEYREQLAQFFPEERPGFVSLEGFLAAKLLCTALDRAGPELTTEKLVEAMESINNLDFGLGTPITFSPSEHQGSHKVWATVLDAKGQFQNMELD